MNRTSGTLIRSARQGARLSQTELARRAGIAQSVISAYESGRREPGLPTLRRLLAAAGHDLVIDVVSVAGRPLGLPDSARGRRLRRRRRAIIEAAARRGAHNIRVFGSVARGEDTEASDIDLLVDLDPEVGLFDLAGLTRELTALLGATVDVIPADALKQRMRDAALAEAVPL